MKDSLAPFKGVNAIPCPLGMDIELNKDAAEISLQAVQTQTLTKLNKDEIITDKLFIMLNHELQEKNRDDI